MNTPSEGTAPNRAEPRPARFWKRALDLYGRGRFQYLGLTLKYAGAESARLLGVDGEPHLKLRRGQAARRGAPVLPSAHQAREANTEKEPNR